MTSDKKKIDPFTPDKDNPKWSEKDFAKARPADEVFEKLGIKPPRPIGRPASANPKISISIRLDKEVVEHFKSSGKGWQTRINETLRHKISTTRTSENNKKSA